jgi:hypothetical protein
MAERNINLLVFVVSLTLTFALIKALSYLPSRYYFTFSQVIDSKNQTQFIAGPELPSPEAYCRALLSNELKITVPAGSSETDVRESCNRMGLLPSIQNLTIQSSVQIDGEFLNGDEYRSAMSKIISYLKRNESGVRTIINSAGTDVRNSISALSNEEVEKILVKDGFFSTANIVEHMAGEVAEDKKWEIEAQLRSVPELLTLLESLERETQTDLNGIRVDPEWQKRANSHRSQLLEKERSIVRGAIMTGDRYLFWPALLLKLVPPFLAGFMTGLFWRERAIFDAPVAAGVVAFLFCWPVIVLWDNVVATEWNDKRGLFYGMYVAYVLSYYFVCKLGAQLALKAAAVNLPEAVTMQIEWNKILATCLTTFLTSAATAALTWSFANAG